MVALDKQAVVFDIDDTLYDQMIPFQRAYQAVFEEKYGKIDIEKLYARSRFHSDVVFEASQRGEMSMEEMYIYRIQKAFLDLAISIKAQDALLFQKIYAEGQKKIEMSRTIVSMLENLKEQGTVMGVISNGPSAHQWEKVRQLGLMRFIPEAHIIISGDFGVAKPEKQIFDIAGEKLKIKKVVYVGDSYGNDIEGAKKAGWQAVWLNRRNHRKPESRYQPDSCVTCESELKSLLVSMETGKPFEIADG